MRIENGIAYPEGDLTMATGPALLSEGDAALQQGCMAFDLAGVAHVDSAALSLMLAWRRRAQAKGALVNFRNIPKSLADLAALYGVDEFILS